MANEILTPTLYTFTETSQADFQLGTLNNVEATSTGELVLKPIPTYNVAGIANLWGWWDACYFETLYGSISDGTVCDTWTDASVNGRNFTNATATYRPSYYNNTINGLPAIRFGGTNQYLYLDYATTNMTIAFDLFIAFKDLNPTRTTADAFFATDDATSSTATFQIGFLTTGSVWRVVSSSNAQVGASGSNPAVINIGCGSSANGYLQTWINGVAGASISVATRSFQRMMLGRGRTGNYCNVAIGEVIFVAGRKCTTAERTEITNYLMQKWGAV
jgi:hypothetical protein